MSRAVRVRQDKRVNSDRYHDLADALALAVTDPDSAAAELTASPAGLSGPGWLRLDESARRFNAVHERDCAAAEWAPRLAAVFLPCVVAASMARDGRVRETAVEAHAGIPGPVASAALAVLAGLGARRAGLRATLFTDPSQLKDPDQ
jgi:hypothetical protein